MSHVDLPDQDAPDVPITYVGDYVDGVHVLRSPAYVQIRPESGHGAEYTTVLAHGTVLHVDGEDHFERRRLLSALFRRRILDQYESEVLLPSLERTMSELAVAGSSSDHQVTVDLLDVCRDVLVDLLARLVGLKGLETRAEREVFLEDFADYELGFRAKFVEDPAVAVRRALCAKDRILERHFSPAWEQRTETVRGVEAGDLPASALPNDLITLLITNREHYGRWGNDVAWREALLFMVASVGSTANALCHAVADILGWVEANPEQRGSLRDSAFLDTAFRESVRLHQTNVLLRTVRTDDTLPSGRRMPAGSVAAVDRDTINRGLEARSTCPQERFDPNREMAVGVHDYGLAFGDGPHSCIGRTMVMGEYGTSSSRDTGQLQGLAVAVLGHLFSWGAELVPQSPPEMVPGMNRETWMTFPVVFDMQRMRSSWHASR